MEISYLVVMILPLVINAIQVPSLSTGTRKLDNREDGSTTTESTANTENQECGYVVSTQGWNCPNGMAIDGMYSFDGINNGKKAWRKSDGIYLRWASMWDQWIFDDDTVDTTSVAWIPSTADHPLVGSFADYRYGTTCGNNGVYVQSVNITLSCNDELVLAGYRCYNFPNCGWLELENGEWKIENGCGKSKVRAESEELEDLKEACLNDDNCIAVSCEDKVSDDKDVCSRFMLSTYCDSNTIDDENNWTIHLLKPTNTGIFKSVQTGTCESNDMKSIHDVKACSKAATELGADNNNVIFREGTYGNGRPTGCSWHSYGNLELWESSTGDCNVHGYDGCFCIDA